MKFVALLSGGKDSCYNIEKCIQFGHRLECVANLHPPLDAGVDEVNSYMYQSAAYNAIPQLAQCLGVPLIRRALAGIAVLQTLDYEKTTNDEVEDLYELLLEVKVAICASTNI
jgi:diphthine-ammonia ligase